MLISYVAIRLYAAFEAIYSIDDMSLIKYLLVD